MPHSPVGRSIPGFKPNYLDVGDYGEELESLARHLLDPSESDLLSRVLGALRVRSGPAGVVTVKTWLHRIASTEARFLRQRRRPGAVDACFEVAAGGHVSTPFPDLGEVSRELQTRMGVLESLAGLPGNYRCALLLREGEGLRVDVVARLMGITTGATRSVLYRARQALRQGNTPI